jgi:hypothetical protein
MRVGALLPNAKLFDVTRKDEMFLFSGDIESHSLPPSLPRFANTVSKRILFNRDRQRPTKTPPTVVDRITCRLSSDSSGRFAIEHRNKLPHNWNFETHFIPQNIARPGHFSRGKFQTGFSSRCRRWRIIDKQVHFCHGEMRGIFYFREIRTFDQWRSGASLEAICYKYCCLLFRWTVFCDIRVMSQERLIAKNCENKSF